MSNNYNSTLQSNNTDLQAILNQINELPETAEQVRPTISVNSSGLITATAGNKFSTHQLAFQPAKTITPTTANQIAVSASYYTGGDVMVAGDSNLVAGNIKSGVSIFGVNGVLEDTSEMEDGLVTGAASTYTNNRVTKIGYRAFYSRGLRGVSFPACISIGENAFYNCYELSSISFPVCTSIGSSAFYCCSTLTQATFPACTYIGISAFYSCNTLYGAHFPVCTSIGSSAFSNCASISSLSFPACTNIGRGAFYNCLSLSEIYLIASSVCALSNSNAFSNTSIWSNKGSIFVPSSLVASYKTATNWAFFSNRIYSA